MEFSKEELTYIIKSTVNETITETQSMTNKPLNVVDKMEFLLINYNNLERIVRDKELEVEELRKFGVPKQLDAVHVAPNGSILHSGLVLENETVERAVHTVQASVKVTVQVLYSVQKALDGMKTDPYYGILEMLYFDGETQESIANHFGCTQQAISKHKKRLLRQLALEVFTDEFLLEILK